MGVTREPAPVPGVEEVRRIAAVTDPVLRNLEITQAYARLAAAFAGRGGEGANWCTYATWASRQAGATIRGEDLLERLERKLAARRWLVHPLAQAWRTLLRRGLFRPETRLGRLTAELHTPFDAFERASAAVARGNLKVFAEIGLEFARYLAECPADAAPGSPELERFLDGLRPGDPPDGQRYLRRAFAHYERSRHEPDPKARTELTVLANLEIGLHEQTRLQPEIRGALDAAAATHGDLRRRALAVLFPRAARSRLAPVLPAGAIAAAWQRSLSRLAREVITESLLVLTLPDRVLQLGRHLGDDYPEALREPRDAELRALLARFEPAPPARDDCGARDWSELDQRMHYLVHLFCAFHLREELAQPPFTAEELEALRR